MSVRVGAVAMNGKKSGKLDERLLLLYERADAAFEQGDWDYTINVCESLLVRVPAALEVRQLLRKAQKGRFGDGRPSRFTLFVRAGSLVRLWWLARNDPERCLVEAESLLSRHPYQPRVHRLLGECAFDLGDLSTAAFSFAEWQKQEPDRLAAHLALVGVLLSEGCAVEAIAAAEVGVNRFPDSVELRQLLKNASVALSMEEGSWNVSGDFRNKLAVRPDE